ncbi:MAG: UDP-3-O-(3-hydroxymyristoyl)glucosamine N-acyltransferase [Candidatus Omnitrophica bacterium]|nr:UDP-3-O-(3-hydroxymyristoyl)glucosamine N-acyltransferase [Candidatus Omnitrophota bacterium]MBU4473139.1 UDP-3-O-(3-hydroxymyristoyl)glucosamine N-acyltransferase [Candidatus Omnitrophota bacterium]MCG2706426.1 UDP-3-O-(3-hydroxymyristoyl)glucosamine N-acyltransferase [Candidatus Omnitrophota bacterium]
MQKTLREIAELINGQVVGDDQVVIRGVSGIKEAVEGDITFVANPKYFPFIEKTRASAIVTPQEIKTAPKPIIRTENPSLAFVKIVSLVNPTESRHPQGIHPTAVLGEKVSLGNGVAIGAYAFIGDNVSIGEKSIIYSGCYVGYDTKIGNNTVIYPNASIRERITIGNRVVIHSGSVVGSDGFGFVTVDGTHHRVPQIGTVVIEDDVEIGSNVTIDRARFDKTVIGRGTKIDNLVQIAHNVVIGENCFIVSQAGISGSTTLGNNVILAGQAGVVGHINIGDNSVVMAQSGVSKSIPAGTTVWGYPAKPHDTAKRINACVHNLPRLYNTIAQLKKKIEQLEAQIKISENPRRNG